MGLPQEFVSSVELPSCVAFIGGKSPTGHFVTSYILSGSHSCPMNNRVSSFTPKMPRYRWTQRCN
jgi:hypothetical protein